MSASLTEKLEYWCKLSKRWDSLALQQKIIGSQKSRFAFSAAMQAGAREYWDYNPPLDALYKYVRNDTDWTLVTDRFRFPPVQ